MSKIAIIPARGGSKRVPRKNIKCFFGKPILAYSIEAALKSKYFDEVIVSTDDEEISQIAIKYGASVPFYRSKENSDDYSGLAEVLIEVLNQYKKRKNKIFEHTCCILATAPFLNSKMISSCFDLMQKKNADAAFPVAKYSYPIQRSLKISKNYTEMVWPENYLKRSQDLQPRYYDAGLFY